MKIITLLYKYCQKPWLNLLRTLLFIWNNSIRPCLLLYKIFKNFKNILMIFILTIQKVHYDSITTVHKAQIYVVRESDYFIKYFIMTIEQIISNIEVSGGNIEQFSVYLDNNTSHQNLTDLFSCIQLYPSIKNIEFIWLSDIEIKNHIEKQMRVEKSIYDCGDDFFAFIDNEIINTQIVTCCQDENKNHLHLPISTRVWARNILKGHSPLTYFVAMEATGLCKNSESQWKNFFIDVWKTYPDIHFFILNKSLDEIRDFDIGLPNVTVTKMLGYNLLEEFAIVQLADMYMGSYGTYAAIVIKSEKPFLLFDLDGTDKKYLAELIDPASHLLLERQKQILPIEDISPDYLFNYFRRFYMDLSARHRIS
jgi:hypothetical protein